MKKVYKFLLMMVVISSSLFYSCETTQLEITDNPNGLSPDKADPDFLLNSIQVNYKNSIGRETTTGFNNLGEQLGRIAQMNRGSDYLASLDGGTLDRPWSNFYSGMLPDIANIEALNSPDNDLSFHLGIAKTLEAHMMMLLVDYLGDIVFSQATNPSEFPTPALDNDQDVYNAAIALLDDAKTLMENASPGSATDLFYQGDTTKWIKLINTLKMRANLTVGNYQAVVDATNVIEDTADDFEFKYGTNVLSPDNRHPDYIADYRSDGANIYKSNWLMNLMVGDFGDFSSDTDPRRRYYFYRQTWRTPGNYALIRDVNGQFGDPGSVLIFNDDTGNGETLQCSIQDVPPHLQFTPDENIWCSLPLGYWGRSHMDSQGIPPDNFTRTASGVYPAGGSFDGTPDAFPFVGDFPDIQQQVALGNGGGGAGIEPIMLASYVHFMKAEASLHLGNTADASTHMRAGITTSINKVMSFGSLDPSADMSQAPDQDTVNAFIDLIMSQFDAAPTSSGVDGRGYPVTKDKMDILGEQYFVAMYGGGADAFNFIRRTGYPRTIARSVSSDPGVFPRTILYPSTEVSSNPSILQRPDNSTKVFWDAGIINPAN